MHNNQLPIDRGWAWVVMMAVFFNTAFIAGMHRSFGMIFVEILDYYDGSARTASLMFSLAGCISMFIAPLVMAFVEILTARGALFFGSGFICLAYLSSALSVSLVQTILCYGFLMGIGNGFLFTPGAVVLAQYFNKKRALANGVAFSGSGFGTIVVPYLLYYFLAEYGTHGTMIILAGIALHGMVFGSLFRPITFYKRALSQQQNDEPLPLGSLEPPKQQEPISVEHVNGQQPIRDGEARSCDRVRRTISESPGRNIAAEKHNGNGHHHNLESFLSEDNLKSSFLQEKQHHKRNGSCVHSPFLQRLANSLSFIPSSSNHRSGSLSCDKDDNSRPNYLSAWNLATSATSIYDLPAVPELYNWRNPLATAVQSSQRSLGSGTAQEDTAGATVQQLDSIEEEHANYKSITSQCSDQAIAQRLLAENKSRVESEQPITAELTLSSLPNSQSKWWKRLFYVRNQPFIDFKFLHNGTFLLFCLASSLGCNFFWMGMVTPPRARELGMRTQDTAMMLSGLGIADTVGRLFAGFCGDMAWLKPHRLLVLVILMFCSGLVTCLAVLATSFGGLLAVSLVAPFFFGCMATTTPVVLADIVGVANMGKAWGLVLFMQGFSVLLGPIVVGSLADWTDSWGSGFLYMGLCMVIASVFHLSVFLVRRRGAVDKTLPNAT